MVELRIGSDAPDFSLQIGLGVVLLSEFSISNKKNIVLYFYPKDNAPCCVIEAKDFRDKIENFYTLDTLIVGVSKDSIKSHVNFKSKYSLPFHLVSDESTEILRKYGVYVEKSMFGKKYMGIERATFLIDKKGKIVKIWKNVKVIGHVDEVLEEVTRL